jgi:hypothetical protein
MGQTESVVLVILLALLAANWPFITQRLFGILKLAQGKSLFVRLLELIALYFIVGGIGMLLEQRLRRKSGSFTRSPPRLSSPLPFPASCGATCSNTDESSTARRDLADNAAGL